MKALTIWQPWATLIAQGTKTIETRGRLTHHRGPLAIHAARRAPRPHELALLGIPTDASLPLGAVIATCELIDCVPAESRRTWGRQERYGDYTPGRWAWILDNVQPIGPVPARGQQCLWDWMP